MYQIGDSVRVLGPAVSSASKKYRGQIGRITKYEPAGPFTGKGYVVLDIETEAIKSGLWLDEIEPFPNTTPLHANSQQNQYNQQSAMSIQALQEEINRVRAQVDKEIFCAIPWLGIDKSSLKCTCGTDSLHGGGKHSDYCDKYIKDVRE